MLLYISDFEISTYLLQTRYNLAKGWESDVMLTSILINCFFMSHSLEEYKPCKNLFIFRSLLKYICLYSQLTVRGEEP